MYKGEILKQCLLHTHTHTHNGAGCPLLCPTARVGRRAEGRACSCTCPPHAVTLILFGGRTRIHADIPGTEGPRIQPRTPASSNNDEARDHCDETRASDKTRPAPAPKRDQRQRQDETSASDKTRRDKPRDHRAILSISSPTGVITPCRVSSHPTPHSPVEIRRLPVIGRGACRGVSIPRPLKRLCFSCSSPRSAPIG